MSSAFKLVLARVEWAPVKRRVFDPGLVTEHPSLVHAVRAAADALASGLIPHIERDGIVFLPQHVQVLVAELEESSLEGTSEKDGRWRGCS